MMAEVRVFKREPTVWIDAVARELQQVLAEKACQGVLQAAQWLRNKCCLCCGQTNFHVLHQVRKLLAPNARLRGREHDYQLYGYHHNHKIQCIVKMPRIAKPS